ncbi:MAG TPA: ABC transporter permease [Vicinamibacterales bacterium]|nr:ABC transporter permease [Vicinamibacterales bacterium]
MNGLVRPIRLLAHHPRFTILAVLTLAAGIGANTAMFGLLDAVYFRPLPLANPDQLVDVKLVSPDNRFSMLSYEEFRDIERNVPAFKDVMVVGRRGVTLHRSGEAQLLLINYVSGSFFPSLGIPMHLGRGFTAGDDHPDATAPQVVINHHLWKERLGAAPDIIGNTIQLNNTPFTVIGVTAPGFVGLDRIVRTDVWVTTSQAPYVVPGLREELENRRQRWFNVIGRLQDETGIREARAELELLLARWRTAEAAAASDYQAARLVLEHQRDATRKGTLQGAVYLALVGLVLLIACANVANLTLARGEGRRRELSLRAALGATRFDLLRQLIVESALMSFAGAAAGVLIASWLMALFPALLPPGASSIMLDLRVDARLLGFAAVAATLTTALVGLIPAWRSSRADITTGLKAQAATTTGSGRRIQLRDVLVIGEIALSGVVMIAAGLLVRSFAQSLAIEPGFDTRKNVATFYLVPGLKGYGRDATYRLLDECRRAVGALPGVTRASYAIRLPAQGNEAGWSASFRIPGKEPPAGKDAFTIRYTMVGPDYFAVMGTRILSGRGFADVDRPDSAPVAVISESMARQFWPGENPVGRRIQMGRQRPVNREIVGVAEDIRIGGLYEAPEMYVYVPFAQDAQSFGLLLVETAREPASIIDPVRRRITQIDAALPILQVRTFAEHMDLLLYEERRNAWIALAMALLALTLGAVGVHGVVSLVTARRAREVGIRVALGATRAQLVRLLIGRGAALAAAGGALAIGGGIAAGRLLSNQLHGIRPADAWSLVVGVVVCVAVALSATIVPVWRAARIDPAVALRDE